LLLLIFTWEEWSAFEEFCEDAPETPHVDSKGVFQAEDDLRSPVETTLYVGKDLLVIETTGAEIDEFDGGLIG
jgi:hypothetical protein